MITLYKAYPYDNSYDYTKFFSNKSEQDNFFKSFDSIDIEEHNYIKVENTFNVNYGYDYLEHHGINYIKFDNGFKIFTLS